MQTYVLARRFLCLFCVGLSHIVPGHWWRYTGSFLFDLVYQHYTLEHDDVDLACRHVDYWDENAGLDDQRRDCADGNVNKLHLVNALGYGEAWILLTRVGFTVDVVIYLCTV